MKKTWKIPILKRYLHIVEVEADSLTDAAEIAMTENLPSTPVQAFDGDEIDWFSIAEYNILTPEEERECEYMMTCEASAQQ